MDVQKSVALYIVVMETRNDPWWQSDVSSG